MSRILIWSPNYAPELIGIPPLVTDAAEWLSERGHYVDVVTAVPNYPERRIHPEYRGAIWRSATENGVRVHRSWLRVRPEERFVDKALYELSFAALSAPRVLARVRAANVVVCVIPSLLAASIAATVARRTRLVVWVQDLVGLAARTVADAPRAASGVANRLERYASARADNVVVCSPGFEDYFLRLGTDPGRIETILNWVDTKSIIVHPPPANGREKVRFLYSGNLGYTQGFETLADAAARVGIAVEVEVVGAGNASEHVMELGLSTRLPVPRNDYPTLLASADAHIVLQRGVAAGANLPSKIASYLASGRPIVASIERTTPAARLLEESGAAIIVPPESPDELARAMQTLAADPGLRRTLGARGRRFAEERLSKDVALAALELGIVG